MKAGFRAAEPEGRWPGAFGVVTACNPDVVTIPDGENEELAGRLELSLLEDGKEILPGDGL